jgi:H+-translocating NAD(P) transhydrogenase subunit alpha
MAQRDSQESESSRTDRVTIGVPRETAAGETRVSLIPDTVRTLSAKGIDIVVQSGAGEGSSIHDDEYTAAGATVLPDAQAVYQQADIIIKVQGPNEGEDVEQLRQGQILVSPLAPLSRHDMVRTMAERGVTTLAMDAVPRITRAQSMDSLSAMSTIGGYKAVLLAADHLPKFFPLLMTAAGTIAPAKVLVLGAGVAGLQAIATARRLGAVVEAYDIRPVAKEQVESLGAKFIEIDVGGEDMQTAGGYARALTPEEQKKQQEALNDHIARFDVVITTALVPGRPAPKMIPEVAVQRMRTGSVIVDLAAETGGNCELTVPGEIVQREGVTIIGLLNLPAMLPVHASQMYARVIQNLLNLLIQDEQVNLNMDDEIFKGMVITHGGEIVQEQTRKVMGLDEAPAAPAPAPVEPEPETTSEVTGDAGSDAPMEMLEEGEDGADDILAVEAGEDDAPIELPSGGDDVSQTETITPVDHDESVEVRTEPEYQPGHEEVRLEPAVEPQPDRDVGLEDLGDTNGSQETRNT